MSLPLVHREYAVGEALEHQTASADIVLTIYLQEIGRVPLLTAPAEVELARLIADGRAADTQRPGHAPLAWADTPEPRAAARADEARRQLVEANLRLVVSVARRYANRGIPLADLIQEGNVGLLRAVDRFDHRLGFKFSTYATWWIRQAITRAIADHGRTIRIPVHVLALISQILRSIAQLQQELGREPTIEEISRVVELPAERVTEIMGAPGEPVSLDASAPEQEEQRLSHAVVDDNAVDAEWSAEHAEIAEQIIQALYSLTARERRVIAMRYGLDGAACRTLAEVADRFRLSRERVRQIELKALQKLRRQGRLGYLGLANGS